MAGSFLRSPAKIETGELLVTLAARTAIADRRTAAGFVDMPARLFRNGLGNRQKVNAFDAGVVAHGDGRLGVRNISAILSRIDVLHNRLTPARNFALNDNLHLYPPVLNVPPIGTPLTILA